MSTKAPRLLLGHFLLRVFFVGGFPCHSMTSLGLTAVGGGGMGTKGIGCCSLSFSFDFASGLLRIISKVSVLARRFYSDRRLVGGNFLRINLTLFLVRRVIAIV